MDIGTTYLPFRLGESNPLSMDLRARTQLLISTTHLEPRLLDFPIAIPQIIWDVALSDASQPSSAVLDLLEALSKLLGHEILSHPIITCFSEIILDLFARWLEATTEIHLDVWESRLTVVAMLPEIRPELWR